MNQHEILTKLNDLKGNLQHLFAKRSSSNNAEVNTAEADEVDNFVDDLPLTLARDAGPGVTYYDTENSQFALGARKEKARGIDKFN